VRSAPTECLDWMLVHGRRQLERVLRTYTAHYNTWRPIEALTSRRRTHGLTRAPLKMRPASRSEPCSAGSFMSTTWRRTWVPVPFTSAMFLSSKMPGGSVDRGTNASNT
jgi:hypothetical protein